jgi:hypothetical protein
MCCSGLCAEADCARMMALPKYAGIEYENEIVGGAAWQAITNCGFLTSHFNKPPVYV